MIISPLGAIIMPDLGIGPQRFGEVVSAYAFSAGISGIVAAGFADRFDRKRFLLFFYFGFIIGTALCALAPNYHLLLLARIVTGLFGGVIGSVVLAIATDLFPFQMRGRVLGVVQTAFSASQVLGIPVGLYIANRQCICAASLRRRRLDNRGRRRCARPQRRSTTLRLVRVHRRRDDTGIPRVDVLHSKNSGEGSSLTMADTGRGVWTIAK
jgi:hypothetical protein